MLMLDKATQKKKNNRVRLYILYALGKEENTFSNPMQTQRHAEVVQV